MNIDEQRPSALEGSPNVNDDCAPAKPTSHQSSGPSEPLFPIVSDENVLSGLPNALRAFRRGSELGDGGRSGIAYALTLAIAFLGSRLTRADKNLLEPLFCLMHALRDLSRGVVHPALEPRPISHRKPTRWDVMEFKATCLVASNALTRDGMSRKEADKAIMRQVMPSAGLLGLKMTDKSLMTWRRTARKSSGDEGYLRIRFRPSHVDHAPEGRRAREVGVRRCHSS